MLIKNMASFFKHIIERMVYLRKHFVTFVLSVVISAFILTGCARKEVSTSQLPVETSVVQEIDTAAVEEEPLPTMQNYVSGTQEYESFPKRPNYMPGEEVDYIVQAGDTLPALAARFNTSESEIRAANPIIPMDVTTLPPGMPMKIPIYYRSLWGNPYQILPDGLFPLGPAQVGFNARSFVDRQPGWFKYYTAYTGDNNRRGGEIIDYIAENYSISPRLLLALLEYRTGALSSPNRPDNIDSGAVMGFGGVNSKHLAAQMNRLSNYLNEKFYQYREGNLLEYTLTDGSLVRIDPWQNAATAAIQHYFSEILSPNEFYYAISEAGFTATYKSLFGEFPEQTDFIPGSLTQPEFALPFEAGKSWAFTGGPHAAWGDSSPYSAIDFAPPSAASGCVYSDEWVTAPADGVIVRTDFGVAVLDLDGDGDERTGWNVFFLHLLTSSIPPKGTVLKQGQPIGHPSCDGGTSTGTHVHLARKYNGEWISAGGVIPFEFDHWRVENGAGPYLGSIRRYSSIVIASESAEYISLIQQGPPLVPTQTPTAKPK